MALRRCPLREDLTLIYYTASVLEEGFAQRVRESLLLASAGRPIISVSQKPLIFGTNLCIGEIGITPYNVYKQFLMGAHAAKTEYVVCCEDDTLYSQEHFDAAPEVSDAFLYNTNRWWIESSGVFRWRDRAAMCACIVNRKFAIEVLEARFEKFPNMLPGRQAWRIFGEPGRCETKLGLPKVKMIRYKGEGTVVTFNHRGSLGGKRRVADSDLLAESLPTWGIAAELWKEMYFG